VYRQLTLLGIVAALLGGLVFVGGIDKFLAVSRPVDANILVVEGWIWESSAIREAAEEFKRGRYAWLVTVGVPISGKGQVAEQRSSADLAAARLQELGVDKHLIVALAVPSVSFHQTYTSALTLRN
jgi:hypothetical protein